MAATTAEASAGALTDGAPPAKGQSVCKRGDGSQQQQQQQRHGQQQPQQLSKLQEDGRWRAGSGAPEERADVTEAPSVRSLSPPALSLPESCGQEVGHRCSLIAGVGSRDVEDTPSSAHKRTCRFAGADANDRAILSLPKSHSDSRVGSDGVPRGISREYSGTWAAGSIHSERSPCPSPAGSSTSARHHPGAAGEPAASPALQRFLSGLDGGDLDQALIALSERQRYLQWRRLPERIILLRHGESEGNINRSVYTTKGDSLLELTPKGLQQAQATGARLKELIKDDTVYVCLSPFERTQQTLLGLFQGGLPEEKVAKVLISSQIREQEFGNFQSVGTVEAAKAEASVVGRFYYRRPNAESSADVYDRVSAFWDQLLSAGNDGLLMSGKDEYDTCLIVTHGLTVRLLMMKIFQWSVETFETVWNIGNCDYITLRKDMRTMTYRLCDSESYPPRLPWATRSVWIVFKSKKAEEDTEKKLRLLSQFKASEMGGRVLPAMNRADTEIVGLPMPPEGFGSELGEWPEIDRAIDEAECRRMRQRATAYTVVDYLSVPQPRTVQRGALKGKLVEGHKFHHKACPAALLELAQDTTIDWDDVELIDWWGDRMSFQGKMLRVSEAIRANLMHNSTGRSSCDCTAADDDDLARGA